MAEPIRDLLPKLRFDLSWIRFDFSSDFSDDFDSDLVIQADDPDPESQE